MSIHDFCGYRFKRLYLPSGDSIVCFFYQPDGCPDVSLHDENHNVYRLNPAGEVVWQVRRDDTIMPKDWWEVMHRIERARGLDGKRKPFTYIWLEYTDGRPACYSDEHGDGDGIAMWEPGCIIHLSGSDNSYVLDPETGIAKNVETGPGRPGW